LLGEGDGEVGLGDGIHGRRENGDIEWDSLGEVGPRVGIGGQNRTPGGDEENVVEGKAFHQLFREHMEKEKQRPRSRRWYSSFYDRRREGAVW
jgi:hypothetical protein